MRSTKTSCWNCSLSSVNSWIKCRETRRLACLKKQVYISRNPYASAMEKQAFPLLSACRVLVEYLGKDFLKELNMAFVSIGQKYGFVSIGDYFRQQLAEERQQMTEERQQLAEEHLQMAEERQQITEERLQMTEERLQITEERLQMTEERLQITEERLQMTEERQQFEEKLAKERDKLNKVKEEKINTARGLYKDKVPIEILIKRFNLTKEQILGK